MEDNPQLHYVEMDTVIGSAGGKVILTIHFVNVDFMFGILLDNKTAAEAGNKISLALLLILCKLVKWHKIKSGIRACEPFCGSHPLISS